jgi:hypothetical protein
VPGGARVGGTKSGSVGVSCDPLATRYIGEHLIGQQGSSLGDPVGTTLLPSSGPMIYTNGGDRFTPLATVQASVATPEYWSTLCIAIPYLDKAYGLKKANFAGYIFLSFNVLQC